MEDPFDIKETEIENLTLQFKVGDNIIRKRFLKFTVPSLIFKMYIQIIMVIHVQENTKNVTSIPLPGNKKLFF